MKKEVSCVKCNTIRVIGATSKPGAYCRACSSIGKNLGMKHSAETKKKHSVGQLGEKNPFYGKKHSEKSKLGIGKYERSAETKQLARDNLARNRRDNTKSNYIIWLEKYGEDVANEKLKLFKEKQSIANRGERNSMYGRPSPQGSGNGWSGWYAGHYFRSLLELSFLVYLITNKIQFETGELIKHSVQYETAGIVKNYFCDFYLIETEEHIEIKPIRLTNTVENIAKFLAARTIHKKFKVMTENDFVKITPDEIVKLYSSGELVWLPRYEEKFIKRYLK